jgi:membrane fusion protein (multidrug efflux system)
VGVVTVATGDVGLVTELPGRLEASRVAQVRARAAGIVQQRAVPRRQRREGRPGAVPHRPAPYAAANASAQAALARAQANLAPGHALAERYKPLVEANAISKQDYANAVAAQKQAEADVAAGRAAVQTARSTWATPPSPRRSPAASAARWSPKARWSARARPRRWP